ncbi:unnamed protein product [Caenorhabditis auriculariae]|uniref:Uncharacterized protein n=1 Tax=Caenorhabditis auriculariae TaxID=2777116 RepID=A0A8S1HCV1_9PELO|nr:unnamed protein product [Caenorhabditis auriculariae]
MTAGARLITEAHVPGATRLAPGIRARSQIVRTNPQKYRRNQLQLIILRQKKRTRKYEWACPRHGAGDEWQDGTAWDDAKIG